MSTISVNIDEQLKKWLRDTADQSISLGNLSDVVLYCIKYAKKNPGVLPQ